MTTQKEIRFETTKGFRVTKDGGKTWTFEPFAGEREKERKHYANQFSEEHKISILPQWSTAILYQMATSTFQSDNMTKAILEELKKRMPKDEYNAMLRMMPVSRPNPEITQIRNQYKANLEGLKKCLERAKAKAPRKYNGMDVAGWEGLVDNFTRIVAMSDADLANHYNNPRTK